jgi:hypothetical protein
MCGRLVSIGRGAPIWRFCAPIGPKATPLNQAIVAGASNGYAGCVCRCRMVPSAMMSPSGHRHWTLPPSNCSWYSDVYTQPGRSCIVCGEASGTQAGCDEPLGVEHDVGRGHHTRGTRRPPVDNPAPVRLGVPVGERSTRLAQRHGHDRRDQYGFAGVVWTVRAGWHGTAFRADTGSAWVKESSRRWPARK